MNTENNIIRTNVNGVDKNYSKNNANVVSRNSFMKYIVENKWLYILIMPGILYFLIFNYIPMFGILIAFKDFNLVKGIMGSQWIGFDNFVYMFSTKDFYIILKNSILFSVYKLIWGFPFPIFLALILNEVRSIKYKKITQTILYLPHFLSWVVLAGIIMNILSPTEGAINHLVKAFGGEPIAFLQKPEYFRTIVISAGIWKEAGWGTIIYLAAISGIDQEMYEAAYIDGATRLQRIWYITLPSIMATVIILLILNTGHIIKNGFEQIFLLYNPSVYSVADVFETYTYRVGLQGGRFSYSSAVGLFQSLVGFILITVTNLIAKKTKQSSLY